MEIKPCPFCQSPVILIERQGDRFVIKCANCYASMFRGTDITNEAQEEKDYRTLIARWNRRQAKRE